MRLLRSKLWLSVIAAILLCGSGSYYYYALQKPQKKTASVQEKVVTVKKGSIRSTVSGTSQFEAQDMQNVIAPADGTIKTMNLTKNQTVTKGDVLVQISDPLAETNMQAAQSSLTQMEKDLADLQNQRNNLAVSAPVSGKLTLSGNLDSGSNVGKNSRIGSISDTSSYSVKLPFNYEDANHLKQGDKIDLAVDGFLLTKTGVVQSVDSQTKADATGGRLAIVNISAKNDGTLDAGMNVKGTAAISGRAVDSQGKAALDYVTVTPVFSIASGTVKDLKVKSGTYVNQGDTIATLINDTIDDQISDKQASIERQKLTLQDATDKVSELTLTAPFDGVFSTDFANKKSNVLASYPVGSKVEAQTVFGAVASLDYMQLPIQVDEIDLPNIKVGAKAIVKVDALPNQMFQGELTQLSTVGTTTNGVTYFDAVLSVKNSGDLRYGMTATADIIVVDKTGVLTVPIEAVQQRGGKHYVMLKAEDGTNKEQEVEIGEHNSTEIEITKGLNDGDKIVLGASGRQRQTGSPDEIQQLRQQFQGGAGGAGAVGGAAGGAGAGGAGATGGAAGRTGGNFGGGNAGNRQQGR
jgi:HlyD family secretion protein